MTEVYLLTPENVSKERFLKLCKLISKERVATFERIKNTNKQKQSLYVELLLRSVLLQKYIVLNHGLSFGHGPNGRIGVSNYWSYDISISYVDGLVAVAIERRWGKGDVGIDIQKTRDLGEKHIDRVCTVSEKECVKYSEEGWIDRFFEVWTKKEAYLKSQDADFNQSFNEVVIPQEAEQKLFSFKYNDYIVSVCSPSEEYEVIYPEQSSVLVKAFIDKYIEP